MKKFIFILVLLLSNPAKSEIIPYFTPSMDCENSIISLMDNAQSAIDIAVFAITSKTLAKAVENAFDRGIAIRIITDRKQADFKLSKVKDFFKHGINVRVHTHHRSQHNKYVIVDDNALVTGSFNWTYSASHKNNENCLVITDEPKIVDKYIENFNFLWRVNSDKASKKWFLDKGIKQEN